MNKLLFICVLFISFSKIHAQGSAVLSYDKEVNFDGKKKKTTYSYNIKVGSKNDHELGDLNIVYQAGNDVEIHEAAIYTINDKKIRALKKKDFHDRSYHREVTYHDDTYEKYASLKSSTYPHIIKFSYTITESEFLYLANWIPKIYETIPTLISSLQVTYPSDYKVRINASSKFQFSEENNEEFIIKKWLCNENQVIKKEENGPGFYSLIDKVQIIPEIIKYGEEQKVNSWKDYGNWVDLLNQGLSELTPKEIIKIHELTDHLTSDEEKVKVLYNYLQDHTRYINISLGVGGLKPHPASYVCENKYGDCKALTNYMHSMLKEINIPSYFVDVYAGDVPVEIDYSFPSQQFNHVILGVIVDSDTVFLENTSKINPYNYLGSFTQNRKGLWVEKDKSKLIDLPSLHKENTRDSISYSFINTEEGSLPKVQISIHSQRGELFEILNAYSTKQESKLKKVLEHYIIPFDIKTITNIDLKKGDRNTPSIQVEVEAEYEKIYRKIGGFSVITPPKVIDFELDKPGERVNPYWINIVLNKIEKYSYPLKGFTQSDVELPKEFHLKTSFGEFKESYSMNEGVIYLERSIYIKPNKINLEQYEDFYAFYKAIDLRSKKSSIIIKKQL